MMAILLCHEICLPSSFFHRAVATQRATFCMREGGAVTIADGIFTVMVF
jgi:hypothetical protein